jgi:hypothetical protein
MHNQFQDPWHYLPLVKRLCLSYAQGREGTEEDNNQGVGVLGARRVWILELDYGATCR